MFQEALLQQNSPWDFSALIAAMPYDDYSFVISCAGNGLVLTVNSNIPVHSAASELL
jgi:hypothetical protein